MAAPIRKTPVTDTVPKVNNEIAVGEDVEFQRRWWKFEKSVWIVFTFVIALDLLGVFGRGPLAKAHKATGDGAMYVTYERIERTGTPSTLRVHFGARSIQKEQAQLWASEDLVTGLGNKLIAPQPERSVVGQGGILYTFPATGQPAEAVFSLTPPGPGVYELALRAQNSSELRFKILVMP